MDTDYSNQQAPVAVASGAPVNIFLLIFAQLALLRDFYIHLDHTCQLNFCLTLSVHIDLYYAYTPRHTQSCGTETRVQLFGSLLDPFQVWNDALCTSSCKSLFSNCYYLTASARRVPDTDCKVVSPCRTQVPCHCIHKGLHGLHQDTKY